MKLVDAVRRLLDDMDPDSAPEAYASVRALLDPPPLSELDNDDGELINEHWVPGGTLILEPREIYDRALLGAAHQGGTVYAVYSRSRTLEAMVAGGMGEEEAEEFYDFNTSGSIGPHFPVFMLDDVEGVHLEDEPM